MDYVKKLIEKRALHKMEHDSRVNERLMQTTEEKTDTSNALDASSVSNISDPYIIRANVREEVLQSIGFAKKKDISENRASRNFDLMITQ
ncbi:hypothetical protein Tco_0520036 [Tanacetum coccineum]